jgi:hypothetical protein
VFFPERRLFGGVDNAVGAEHPKVISEFAPRHKRPDFAPEPQSKLADGSGCGGAVFGCIGECEAGLGFDGAF